MILPQDFSLEGVCWGDCDDRSVPSEEELVEQGGLNLAYVALRLPFLHE